MKLYNGQQKYEFLNSCYSNIKRIYDDVKGLAQSPILESQGILTQGLPKSLELTVPLWYKDSSIIKLEVLTAIYNEVAKRYHSFSIDLREIFRNIKLQAKKALLDFDPILFNNTSIDELMGSQRIKYENSLLNGINNFFAPKSLSFLKEYDFFDKKRLLDDSDDDQLSLPAYGIDDIRP